MPRGIGLTAWLLVPEGLLALMVISMAVPPRHAMGVSHACVIIALAAGTYLLSLYGASQSQSAVSQRLHRGASVAAALACVWGLVVAAVPHPYSVPVTPAWVLIGCACVLWLLQGTESIGKRRWE